MSGPDGEYTLPGVMRFLQLEWQRNERDRIQWDIERAEMRSRLARLEADRQTLKHAVDNYEKTVALLKSAKINGEISLPVNGSDSAQGTPRDSQSLVPSETETDMAKLVAVREYLDQCVAEVGFMLEQSGVVPDVPLPASDDRPPFGAQKRLLHTLPGLPGGATALASFGPKVWAIGTGDGTVVVWNASEASKAAPVLGEALVVNHAAGHDAAITGIAARSREGWSCAADGTLAAWELQTHAAPRRIARFEAHSESISALAIHPGDNVVATASSDGTVAFWDTRVTSPNPNTQAIAVRRYTESPGVVPTALHYFIPTASPHSYQLLVGFNDGGIVLTDTAGVLVRRLYSPPMAAVLAPTPPAVRALAVVGNAVVAGHATGDIKVYELDSGSIREEVTGAHHGAVTSISVQSETGSVLSTGADGSVTLWTLSLGGLAWKGRLLGHDAHETGGVRASAWSNDGAGVAGGDGLVRLYDLADL